MIIKGYIFSILYGLICMLIGMISYKLGMPKKYSRKVVHILVGFEWCILYAFMGASYHFMIVCIMFTLLLAVVHFKQLMPMMESDGDNAPGTVYYGVSMTLLSIIVLFVPEMILPFGIGVFCTSFGDGFAGVLGQLIKRYNPKIYGNKSLVGSVTNFVFSFASAFVFTNVFDMGLKVWQCLIIALLAVELELVCTRGLDNIFVTVLVAVMAFMFINLPTVNFYIAPIVMTPLIIMLVNKKRVLTRLGLLFAMALDLVVSLTLGNFGFILLLSFLVGSVLIDKVKALKKHSDTITKKGECRDHIQVIANGLIPMVMALLFSITLNKAFLVGYVAALAEAFADTAASGIGVFSNKTFDPFRMKKCERGLSGGMSAIGTLSSLIGAVLMSLIALSFGAVDLKLMLIASAAAFVGVVFDSMLGSLVQVKYKCSACGKLTEREEHCDTPTEQVGGFKFFDNDVVNFFSGAFSALLAAILCIALI